MEEKYLKEYFIMKRHVFFYVFIIVLFILQPVIFFNAVQASEIKADVVSLWPVENATSGGTTILWAKVKNVTSTTFSDNLFVWFWVTGPSWSRNHWIGFKSLGGLAPYQSSWYSYSWKIDENLIAGTYRYRVSVWDKNELVSEWSLEQDFHINAPIGVTILSLWDVNSLTSGMKAHLWAKIKNIGLNTLPDGAELWFWVEGPNWTGDHWIGGTSISGLKPAYYDWYYYDWYISFERENGDYTYHVKAYLRQQEISEWSAPKHFKVGAPVEIVSTWPVSRVTPSENATLWGQVKNVSYSRLPSGAFLWFWVTGPSWSGDHWVGSRSLIGLKPGIATWYSFDWMIPSKAATGTFHYWVQAWLNSHHAISEWSDHSDFPVIGGIHSWRLIALGDSITYGINHDNPNEEGYVPKLSRLLNHNVTNLGVPGCDIDYIATHLIYNLKVYRPTHVLLLIGANDVESYSFNLGHYIYLLRWIVQTIRDYDAIPYIGTLTPLCADPGVEQYRENRTAVISAIHQYIEKKMNVSIADFAAVFDCSLMEMGYQRHHPNSKGYELMANVWYTTVTTK